MGLDLYAGTLTRYYAHNWKTESQQWAEAHSFGYQKITSEMESENSMSTEEVQQVIETWRDSLLSAIRTEGTSVEAWPENNECPYYTSKPDWPALLLHVSIELPDSLKRTKCLF